MSVLKTAESSLLMHSAASRYLVPQEKEEYLQTILSWLILGQVQKNTEAKGNQCQALDLHWRPGAPSEIPVLCEFVQWQMEALRLKTELGETAAWETITRRKALTHETIDVPYTRE